MIRRLTTPLAVLTALGVNAMTLPSHSSTVNDAYLSGYPATPVRNTDPSFVGAARDWHGVAWSASLATKSFGLLSPRHYLVARHYGGASTLVLLGADHQLHSRTHLQTEDTGLGIIFQNETLGDISIGTLTSPFPAAALPTRLPLLDLHSSSSLNSTAAYTALPLLVFGRGPNATTSTRLAPDSVSSVSISGTTHQLLFSRDTTQLEAGDSGSPLFAAWTNPDGQPEAALLGMHAAIDEANGWNIDNFAASREVINALHLRMNDEGYALRVAGDPAHTWSGSSSQNLSTNKAWNASGPPGAVADKYVLFAPSSAASFTPTVDSPLTLRGLFFQSSPAEDPFTLGGSATLTIGRGGITNYDHSRQVLQAPLALAHPQYWIGGPGGLSIGSLHLGAHLLEIHTTGNSTISGAISGTGSLALSGGLLQLPGTSGYSGPTWVHHGTLRVNGSIASSSSLTVSDSGRVEGHGFLPSLSGAGTLAPGEADGILRAAALDPTGGLDLELEFTRTGAPTFSQPSASGNDLLRLPSIPTLSAANTLTIHLPAPPNHGDRFLGGLFQETDSDFADAIASATRLVYVADPDGTHLHNGITYSLWSGTGEWEWSTLPQTADFPDGTHPGRILSLRWLPPSGDFTYWAYTGFPDDTPAADRLPDATPNSAGLPNRLAYAFGLNPLAPDLSALPYALPAPGELVLRFRRRKIATDLTYLPQTATSLPAGDWSTESITPSVVNPALGDVEEVEIRRQIAPLETQLFLRVGLQWLP